MKKHIIIAGASRSGKTTLSLQLLKDGYVHYKMDSIKRGICGIFDLDQHNWKGFSPILAKLINTIIEENLSDTVANQETYIIDTCHLYPKDVNLINLDNVIVIYLGYGYISPIEQLALIRKYDLEHYWSRGLGDQELLGMIKRNIEFSKYLETECQKQGIPYYDTSYNRDDVLEKVRKEIPSNNT